MEMDNLKYFIGEIDRMADEIKTLSKGLHEQYNHQDNCMICLIAMEKEVERLRKANSEIYG